MNRVYMAENQTDQAVHCELEFFRDWGGRVRFLFAIIMGLWSVSSHAAVLSADMVGVKACLKENQPEHSVIQEIRLRAVDGAGARELKTRVYGLELNEEVAVMISVLEPGDMRDSRYLVIAGSKADAMYMYLPALGRARRIVGSQAGQSLWGTDFSYEDIKLVRGLLNQGVGKVTEIDWDGRAAVAVTIEPDSRIDDGSSYSKIELIVDGHSCVIVNGKLFDETGPVKFLSVEPGDLAELDGRWYAKKVQIRSLRESSKSELIVEKMTIDKNLPARLFNPRTFMHGR